jgi:hypothetical protein
MKIKANCWHNEISKFIPKASAILSNSAPHKTTSFPLTSYSSSPGYIMEQQ